MNIYECRIKSGKVRAASPRQAENESTASLMPQFSVFAVGWAIGIVTYCIIHIITK